MTTDEVERSPLARALFDVTMELSNAEVKFPPFRSAHEGYAILLEEVEELKAEIFHGPTSGPIVLKYGRPAAEGHAEKRRQLMRAEAVQVPAMALRFIKDCC